MVTCYIYLYYSMHQTTCPGDICMLSLLCRCRTCAHATSCLEVNGGILPELLCAGLCDTMFTVSSTLI